MAQWKKQKAIKMANIPNRHAHNLLFPIYSQGKGDCIPIKIQTRSHRHTHWPGQLWTSKHFKIQIQIVWKFETSTWRDTFDKFSNDWNFRTLCVTTPHHYQFFVSIIAAPSRFTTPTFCNFCNPTNNMTTDSLPFVGNNCLENFQ